MSNFSTQQNLKLGVDIFRLPNILNIFCDASIVSHNGETIGCPGAIVVQSRGEELYISDSKFEILRNSTNNKSELTAIFLALQLALKYKNQYPIINIFSDSKISVFGLKEWIFSWYKTMKEDGIMYSSSGREVANQDIIKKIINFVVYNDLHFNLLHQKGHITNSTDKMIKRSQLTFIRSNNISIDRDLDIIINEYNNAIDNQTRTMLKESVNEITDSISTVKPIRNEITIDTIKKYRTQINKTML